MPELQAVIDGCLFEPGQWISPLDKKHLPRVVPTLDRSLFATPCGLLFNELLKSPHVRLDDACLRVWIATGVALLNCVFLC